MNRMLAEGETVQFVDFKDRRYLVTLEAGKEFHSHAGAVAHDDLIGTAEGRIVRSTKGSTYLVLRPTLAERILKMPRGAQVIYPCLLYTSPSPRDQRGSRMPSSA